MQSKISVLLRASKAEPQKKNLFSMIHKFQRRIIMEGMQMTATFNFEESTRRNDFEIFFDYMKNEIHEHSEHEDKFILPHVRKISPEICSSFDQAHQKIDQSLQDIEGIIATLKSDGADISPLSYQLHLSFSDFVSTYLHHMLQEETELMSFIMQHFTVQEIANMELAIILSIPPEQGTKQTPEILKSLNVNEIALWCSDIKAGAPEPAFRGFMEAVRSSLSPEEYVIVTQKIGLETSKF